MEFWAPLENQYLVVGVCIEYVNETSNTKNGLFSKILGLMIVDFIQ